jgi:hypothetical protein
VIETRELRDLLTSPRRPALDTAAREFAAELAGESSGPYYRAVRGAVEDAFLEAVLGLELPTREEWLEAAQDSEAWERAEAHRELHVRPHHSGYAVVRHRRPA